MVTAFPSVGGVWNDQQRARRAADWFIEAHRLRFLLQAVRNFLRSRQSLVLENLARRSQLALFEQQVHVGKRPKPQPTPTFRLLWNWLSRSWPDWRAVLMVVTPATVIRWHRRGFGILRHELLDQCIPWDERHLLRLLTAYVRQYYNPARTHQGIERQTPVQPEHIPMPASLTVPLTAEPILGGLYHTYRRAA